MNKLLLAKTDLLIITNRFRGQNKVNEKEDIISTLGEDAYKVYAYTKYSTHIHESSQLDGYIVSGACGLSRAAYTKACSVLKLGGYMVEQIYHRTGTDSITRLIIGKELVDQLV